MDSNRCWCTGREHERFGRQLIRSHVTTGTRVQDCDEAGGGCRRWPRLPVRLVAVVLASTVVVASCSDTSSDDAEPAEAFGATPLDVITTTTDPSSCDEAEPGASVSDSCAADRYAQQMANLRSEELLAFSSDQLGVRVDSLCREIERQTEAGISATDRPTLLRSVIAEPEWSVTALAELASLARNRCPEPFAVVDLQPGLIQSVLISYSVAGASTAKIDWINAAGTVTSESVSTPWTGEVRLEDPIDVRVDARFDGGTERGCSIAVNGQLVVEQTLPDDAEYAEVRCSVSAAELEFQLQVSSGDADGAEGRESGESTE